MTSALRAQFISTALVILIGIWLTGFNKVHWFLYVPVIMLTLAGVSGRCPGLMLWQKLGLKSGHFQRHEVVGGDARRGHGGPSSVQSPRDPVGSLPTVQPSREVAAGHHC